jgi:hypothetical protein
MYFGPVARSLNLSPRSFTKMVPFGGGVKVLKVKNLGGEYWGALRRERHSSIESDVV